MITPLLGLFVGLLMGLTGAGGGILSVPLLIFGLGLQVNQAAPIALASVAISAGIGASLGLKSKILRYKAALLIGSFGLLLSPLGIWLSHQIPNTPLILTFSAVLFLVSIRMYIRASRELGGNPIRDPLAPPCQLDQSIGKLIWTAPCARSLMLSGVVAGFFSGLLGVGGGFVIVPALKRYTDLPINSIVATSLGVLTIVSTGGALFASAAGVMEWQVAIPFIGGSVTGLIMGRYFIKKIHGARVEQLFAIFTFCVGISLVYRCLG